MWHKMDKIYSVKSVKELDDLVYGENTPESDKNFDKSVNTNNASISKLKVSPKELTINSAIENYIDAERYMTASNHEKAYLCLIRFLKEIQRVIDNGVLGKDHYNRHKDIYDYYLSDEVKSRTFRKLALLRDHLHSEYITMNEMTSDDREKCVSVPNDISQASIEPFVQTSKKSFDIFNINNALKNRNYSFGSNRYINELFIHQKPTLRKCISIPNGLDMKCNQESNFATLESTTTIAVERNSTEYSVSNRVKSITTGYSHIMAPLVVKQTLLKIQEYKQKVELKPKSQDYIPYKWQNNRQIYMIRAFNL